MPTSAEHFIGEKAFGLPPDRKPSQAVVDILNTLPDTEPEIPSEITEEIDSWENNLQAPTKRAQIWEASRFLEGDSDLLEILAKSPSELTTPDIRTIAKIAEGLDLLLEGTVGVARRGETEEEIMAKFQGMMMAGQQSGAASGEIYSTPGYVGKLRGEIVPSWEELEEEFVKKMKDGLYPQIKGVNWESPQNAVLRAKAVDLVFAVRCIAFKASGLGSFVPLINDMRTREGQTYLEVMFEAAQGIPQLWEALMASGEGQLEEIVGRHAGFLTSGLPIESVLSAMILPDVFKVAAPTTENAENTELKSVEKGVAEMMDFLYGNHVELKRNDGGEPVLLINGTEKSMSELSQQERRQVINGRLDAQLVFQDRNNPLSTDRVREGEWFHTISPFDRSDNGMSHWFDYLYQKMDAKGIPRERIVGAADTGGDFRQVDKEHPQVKRVIDSLENKEKIGEAIVEMMEIRDGSMWGLAIMLTDILGLSESFDPLARGAKAEWMDKMHRAMYDEFYTVGNAAERDAITGFFSFIIAWKRGKMDPILIALKGNPDLHRARWMNRIEPGEAPIIKSINIHGTDEEKRQVSNIIENMLYDFAMFRGKEMTQGYSALHQLLEEGIDYEEREKRARKLLETRVMMGKGDVSSEATWLDKGVALSKISNSTQLLRKKLARVDFKDFLESVGIETTDDYTRGWLGLAVAADLISCRTRLIGNEPKVWKATGKYPQAAINQQIAMEGLRAGVVQALSQLTLKSMGIEAAAGQFTPDQISEAAAKTLYEWGIVLTGLQTKEEAANLYKEIVENLGEVIKSMTYFSAVDKRRNIIDLLGNTLNWLDKLWTRNWTYEIGEGEEGTKRKPIKLNPNTQEGKEKILALKTSGVYRVIVPHGASPQDLRRIPRGERDQDKQNMPYVTDMAGNAKYEGGLMIEENINKLFYGHRGIPPGLVDSLEETFLDKKWVTRDELEIVRQLYKNLKRSGKEVKE